LKEFIKAAERLNVNSSYCFYSPIKHSIQMQNRIDIDFDERGFQTVLATAQTFLSNLQKYTRHVSLKERKDGQSMGETMGWSYAQKAFELLTADRSLVHPDKLNYEAFERDIRTARQLLILKNALNGWVGEMEGTFILLGKDLMEQANVVRKNLEGLRNSHSKYEFAFQELNVLYENRAKLAQLTLEHKSKVAALEQQVASLARK
jgi:hypothetical protein